MRRAEKKQRRADAAGPGSGRAAEALAVEGERAWDASPVCWIPRRGQATSPVRAGVVREDPEPSATDAPGSGLAARASLIQS